MPITVKGPNDVTITFPDGTDSATINGVFSGQFGGGKETGLVDKAADYFKSLPGGITGGLARGATDIAKMAEGPLIGLARAGASYFTDDKRFTEPPLQAPIETLAHRAQEQLPKPQGPAGEFGRTTGEFLGNPLSYAGPGGMAGKAALAVTGALGEEAAGQLTAGHPALQPYARGLGAVIGGAGPAAVTDIVRSVTRPGARAAADTNRAIARDEKTPDQLMDELRELRKIRPDATLADVGGENVRGLVERVAQTPGAGRTKVVPALTERQTQQMGRVSKDLSDLTGTQKTAAQAIEETMQAQKTAANPLYDKARNFNARQVPQIVGEWDRVTSTGWGKSILDSPDFKKTLQTEYGVTDATEAPFMTVIDAWKKEADGLVGEAVRSGNNNRARVIGDMRDNLLAVVDHYNPAYKQARAAWAGPAAFMDAIEEGRNILSSKVTAEEIAKRLSAGGSYAEAYRIGALSAIRGKMGNDPAKMADMTKYLRAPEVRGKVAALMPTPEAAQSWLNRLEFEIKSSELTGRSLRNSATARRLAEREDGENIMNDLVMDTISHGSTGGLIRKLLMAVPTKVRDTLRSRTDRELADMLVNPRSADDLQATLGQASRQEPGTASAAALRATAASPLAGGGL